MVLTQLASTMFMLLLVILVLFWIRGRQQRDASTIGGTFFQRRDRGDIFDRIDAAVDSPIVWALIFFILIFATLASVVLFLSDIPLAIDMMLVIAGIFAVAIIGFLLLGVYLMGRSRGHSSALSIAESMVVLGFLAMLAVLAHLVFVT